MIEPSRVPPDPAFAAYSDDELRAYRCGYREGYTGAPRCPITSELWPNAYGRGYNYGSAAAPWAAARERWHALRVAAAEAQQHGRDRRARSWPDVAVLVAAVCVLLASAAWLWTR